MAKKESQDGKSKKGLPRLMELAIYFIIQEIVGAYPDFSTLDVPKVLGYGGLALGGVLLNVLLCTASVELSHIAAYGTLYQCKINYVSHITKLPLDYHLKMGSGKLRKVIINVNIKMYIFDHLRMYIFAILPLDRYIFLSDKIFL